jgi:hypothetical protein
MEEIVLATSWACIREISVSNLEQDLMRRADYLKTHQFVGRYVDTVCI